MLYLLAVGGVQGFAFTLGVTTVIDLVVIFLFTHPMMELLIRTRSFGDGHRLSGLDAEHLGARSGLVYAGRGRVTTPTQRTAWMSDDQPMSIAQRRRAERLAVQDADSNVDASVSEQEGEER